ncbi:hypothetical protein [Streptomyces sp. NPDC005438]|uniref:hypothetical protein n=1 Tax=Streptomyces sp. NPDC005438 TaxID=3156880 RepID=UPI0033A9EAC8
MSAPHDGRPGAKPDGGGVPPHAEGEPVNGQPPRLALELLVHGVGGTTPQEMLGDPRTERVTGDETAAVHRRAEDVDAEEHPERYEGEPVPEAYSWSNLTSGNGARALWLILLPFMVANLSHWMRPAADSRRISVRLYGTLVRLLALTLTVLLIAAACEVALDLLVWQCAGTVACVDDHSWLAFLAPDARGGGGWWSQPGRRLALGALVPLALTGLLWWLSHRTWSAYESQPPLRAAVAEDDPQGADRPALCLPGFWYGKRLVARLRAAHVAAALLTVAAALTVGTTRFDRDAGGPLEAVGWTMTTLISLGGALVVAVICRRGRKEWRTDDALDRFIISGLPLCALGLVGMALVYACWSRPEWRSDGVLPGNEVFGVLSVAQGLLVAAMVGVVWLMRRRFDPHRPGDRTVLRGQGGPAVAVLACSLGAVYTGGVAQRVADWLDGPGTPGRDNGLIAGPPTLLTWHAAAIPVLLGVLALMLLGYLYRAWRHTHRLEPDIHTAYGPEVLPDASRSRRIARTLARARLTDRAPWLVLVASGLTLVLGAVAVLGAWFSGEVPGRATDGAPAILDGFAETAQALGSWLIGLAMVLFLAWGRRAYRDASARRTIGILWDVGTFWPRAAHPFAPPCYAERAVPDLAWRMATWTGQPGRQLVISGHSQGSVLAAAAVWQLDPLTRRKVALLTYGSPLERLYGRWFPAYFGRRALRALHQEVDCWRNLYRHTDPIGGPVRLPEEDGPPVDAEPFHDPLTYGRTVQQPLPAPILGHGEYQADPAFERERAALLRRLAARDPQAGRPPAPRRPEGDGSEPTGQSRSGRSSG